jgi:bifunctional non-homologous end joining protein LigD
LLQQALGGRGGKRSAREAIYYAFDLLYLAGKDLRGLSLSERRQSLEAVIGVIEGPIRLSEEIIGDGDAIFRVACEHGLEGIIAKRRDKPYRSGNKGDWLKIKSLQRQIFAIVGYEPSSSTPGAIARLLLAKREGQSLIYAGSVGTGFTDKVS